MIIAKNAEQTTIERAFELAGRCHGMAELRQQLWQEGRRDHERALFGTSLRQQLQALMRKPK